MTDNDPDYVPAFDEESGIDIAFRDEAGTLRRVTYEPVDDRYVRIEQRWRGASWNVVDRKRVEDLVVERPVNAD